jgi:chromosome segregation ATPase
LSVPIKALIEKIMKIIIRPETPGSQFVNIGVLDYLESGWYTLGNIWRRGDVMAFSKEDLQALEKIFEPIRKDVKEIKQEVQGLKESHHKLDTKVEQGQKKLEQGQKRLETKMSEGFAFLRDCINEAAVDIGRTSKNLREHVERPVH